jgi:hypothetical protein
MENKLIKFQTAYGVTKHVKSLKRCREMGKIMARLVISYGSEA